MFTCVAVSQKETQPCSDSSLSLQRCVSVLPVVRMMQIMRILRIRRVAIVNAICQFPHAACVCTAWLRVIFAHGLWDVVLCSQQVLRCCCLLPPLPWPAWLHFAAHLKSIDARLHRIPCKVWGVFRLKSRQFDYLSVFLQFIPCKVYSK